MPAWRGERLIILLPHEDPAFVREKPYIVVDAANKFGTGAHPTTRICLAILERVVQKYHSVLDVGTGTGILALYAAKVGAEYVVAIDQDLEACKICKQNIAKNSMGDNLRVINGRIDALSRFKLFDIVIANLESDTLLNVIPALKAYVTPSGFVVISGVPAISKGDFTGFLEASSLEVVSSATEDEWIGFLAAPSHR